MLLALAACVEYQTASLEQQSGPGELPDESAPAVETGFVRDTSDTAPLEELCDGADNDGDGAVDEGFADVDADGQADCVDGQCDVAAVGSMPASGEAACTVAGVPSLDPWNVEIMWTSSDEDLRFCRMGAVADIDGDGVQEIACVHATEALLYILDGATGAVEWTSTLLDAEGPVTAADLDRDGFVDLVGIAPDGSVVAIDGTGAEKWRSTEDLGSTIEPGGTSWIQPGLEVVDIDADGTPEVIGHHGIVSGKDGSFAGWLDVRDDYDVLGTRLEFATADADGDGAIEFFYRWRRMDVSGTVAWEATPPSSWRGLVAPALIQADSDDDAEVLWLSDDDLQIYEPDGTLLLQTGIPDDYTFALPCVADLDGDGLSELIWRGKEDLHVRHVDGTTMWKVPVDDNTSGSACTTFDFEFDGVREVLESDESSFVIHDGSTGSALYADTGRSSCTWFEFPIVVDLDADGSVDILVNSGCGSSDGKRFIRAYRNANRDWPPGAGFWPSDTWSGTTRNPDGTVPRTMRPSWLENGGIWRGQITVWVDGRDLLPEVVDSCVASCELEDAEVRLAVRLVNQGPFEVDDEAPIAAYVLDDDGNRVLHDVVTLAELTEDGDTATPDDPWLDDGSASASSEVVLTLAQARHGVVLVAGDDGTGTRVVDDCDPTNDELTWSLTVCP